ncbi:MAG: leucine-rich repeat domain-containing protein [Clostridiales bacterium]|nr:leucine-rich repeat domain-containing protein [Clostridiales bacterium]
MKRKVWYVGLLCIVLTLACAAFVACGDKDDDKGSGGDKCAAGHSYGEWQVVTPATCTEDGVKKHTCSVCSHEETDVIAAAGHAYNVGEICTVCGSSKYTQGLLYELNADNVSYGVAGIDIETDTELNIAPTYRGLPVTAIWDEAFENCDTITSVTIGSSVASIGDRAFSGCRSLTSIRIPQAVTSIGSGAFSYCDSLIEITVDSGNTTYHGAGNCLIETATGTLIAGCKNSVIPADGSVTSIEGSAFEGCVGLTGITVPQSITSIGNDAFAGCGNLTSIEIPSGVTTIGSSVFSGDYALTIRCREESKPSGWSSNWNASCSVVWNCAQNETDESGCLYTEADGIRYSLKEGKASVTGQPRSVSGRITVPSEVTYDGDTYPVTRIGSNAFYSCGGLCEIEIPQGVTSIESSAFAHCENLTSVTIPQGVKSIGSNAFFGCGSLTSITIPQGVTSIGSGAFANCYALTIRCVTTNPSGWNSSWNRSNLPVVWNCNDYEKANNGFVYAVIDGVRYRLSSQNESNKAFVDRQPSNLSGNITIPSSVTYKGTAYNVTSIGLNAFEKCVALTGITIGNGVTSILNYAFRNCSALTNITIPASVTSIGENVLRGCSSLSEITVDGNNQNYTSQDGILYNKEKTEFVHIPEAVSGAITVPSGITEIGEAAFAYCGKLTGITLPQGVTSIGDSAFYACIRLTEITIPQGVTSIGAEAFYGCFKLTDISLPQGLTSIGSGTFYGCINLKSINLPQYVTSIGNEAFGNCVSLTSVSVPGNVTDIWFRAFSECVSLTSITFNGTKAQWTAINKDGYWDERTGNYTVTCTDGTLRKSES